MLGKVFNDRYEIIRELGKGGMAIVYEAKDLLLDRKVAFKMLRPEYTSDKDFIEKFRHEAKAVARLSHPNVVSIFDIGIDEDNQYLVMENVKGSNLKDIIRKRGKLSIVEALDIALQISSALAVAHRNHIIHCDIKPHNILLTPENQVKVTDFGIARAVTSSTITVTDTIMGSAHYFSPEQAKGGEITAHSDIYALGVVLYEMLTGEVPFEGDSPISVALKHLQEEPKEPIELNPEIPEEINKLVLKAMAKDIGDRFSSAVKMRQAITHALKNLKKSANNSKFLVEDQDGDTKILKRSEILAKEEEKSKTDSKVKVKKELKRKGTTKGNTQGTTKRVLTITGIILLLFMIGTAGFLYLFKSYTNIPVVEVPDVTGMELADAQSVAAQVGLELKEQEERVFHDEIPAGHIISQFPAAEERVRQTREITITVSKGPVLQELPDLTGMTLREARVILDNKTLEIGEVDYLFSLSVKPGLIVDQSPAPGTMVSVDNKIKLTISRREEEVSVTMPDLVGLNKTEAFSLIKDNDLQVGNIEVERSMRYLLDQVISQSVKAGTSIAKGTPINLVISRGLINPEDSPVHTTRVRVNVKGSSRQQVKIVVVDDNGEDIVYQENHFPGDTIVRTINSIGPTRIKIYLDGKLLQTQKVGG